MFILPTFVYPTDERELYDEVTTFVRTGTHFLGRRYFSNAYGVKYRDRGPAFLS